MCSSHLGEYHARAMIKGRPEPSWLGFLPHQTPHVVDCCFFGLMDLNDGLTWIPLVNDWELEVLKLRRFFLTLP